MTTSPILKKRLYAVASLQQGYFTAQQATKAGYSDSIHPYHVQQGNWERMTRGVYRLTRYPHSQDSQYVIYALWSRNREGVPQGVYSHTTALSMFDLSDANPAKLHMTVPPGFRRHSKIPKILILHKGKLPVSDILDRGGYFVTRPTRTIRDLLREGLTEPEIVRQALVEGLSRGLVLQRDLEPLSKEFPSEKVLFSGLKKGR